MASLLSAIRNNGIVFFLLQGANLAAIPLLTHSVEPELLAAWFMWFNLIAVLTSMGTLRYELAIVTAKSDEEALGLLAGASGISILVCLVIGAIAVVWELVGGRDRGGDLLALFATVAGACGALLRCQANWNLRAGRVIFHTALQMLPPLLASLCQIGLAKAVRPSPLLLVFGGLCGYLIPALIAVGHFWCVESSRLRWLTWNSMRKSLAAHRRFPIYALPFTGAALIRERAIFGALGLAGDSAAVSLFGLSHRLISFANTAASAPLRPVFFQFVARVGMDVARDHVDLIVRSLSWLVVPAWTAVLIWAPELLGFVLGSEWAPAAPYLRILSVSYFIVAISGWLDRVYDVLGDQRRLFIIEATFSVLTVLALGATLAWSRDPIILTFSTGAVTLLYGWGWLAATYLRIGMPLRRLLGVLGCHVMAAGGMVTVSYIAYISLGTRVAVTAAVVMAILCGYGGIALAKRNIGALRQAN